MGRARPGSSASLAERLHAQVAHVSVPADMAFVLTRLHDMLEEFPEGPPAERDAYGSARYHGTTYGAFQKLYTTVMEQTPYVRAKGCATLLERISRSGVVDVVEARPHRRANPLAGYRIEYKFRGEPLRKVPLR